MCKVGKFVGSLEGLAVMGLKLGCRLGVLIVLAAVGASVSVVVGLGAIVDESALVGLTVIGAVEGALLGLTVGSFVEYKDGQELIDMGSGAPAGERLGVVTDIVGPSVAFSVGIVIKGGIVGAEDGDLLGSMLALESVGEKLDGIMLGESEGDVVPSVGPLVCLDVGSEENSVVEITLGTALVEIGVGGTLQGNRLGMSEGGTVE